MTDKQQASPRVKGSIVIDTVMCKGCELCITFCPKNCIKLSEKLNAAGYPHAIFTGEGQCTGCATCALVCPEVVIEVYRD